MNVALPDPAKIVVTTLTGFTGGFQVNTLVGTAYLAFGTPERERNAGSVAPTHGMPAKLRVW